MLAQVQAGPSYFAAACGALVGNAAWPCCCWLYIPAALYKHQLNGCNNKQQTSTRPGDFAILPAVVTPDIRQPIVNQPNQLQTSQYGLGDPDARFRVYVANRPPMLEYQALAQIQPLCRGEIALINQACGNGWRKVFNVYAKLLFALPQTPLFTFHQHAASWQDYRDSRLLQNGSDTALLFSAPQLEPITDRIHIIAGRIFAKALLEQGLAAQLQWLNAEFAIDKRQRLLVCPYFDYRQLNNEKIDYLVGLIRQLETF